MVGSARVVGLGEATHGTLTMTIKPAEGGSRPMTQGEFADAFAERGMERRRPDAEAVFREAGRYFARQVYATVSPVTRKMMRSLPALLTRPLALRHVRRVAKRYLHGHTLTEGLLNHIEVAIRAYDPCLSCATHALGQMPLQVDLVDAAGRLIDRASRSA